MPPAWLRADAFREKLTEAGALGTLFADFDRQIRERGYLAMGGQIVDDEEAQPIRGIGEHRMVVAAPKQRNTADEKAAIKAGKTAGEIRPGAPARAAQKDTDARYAQVCQSQTHAPRQARHRYRHPQLWV